MNYLFNTNLFLACCHSICDVNYNKSDDSFSKHLWILWKPWCTNCRHTQQHQLLLNNKNLMFSINVFSPWSCFCVLWWKALGTHLLCNFRHFPLESIRSKYHKGGWWQCHYAFCKGRLTASYGFYIWYLVYHVIVWCPSHNRMRNFKFWTFLNDHKSKYNGCNNLCTGDNFTGKYS